VARLDQLSHVFAGYAFEAEEHVIERTVEVKFTGRAIQFRSSFIEAAGQNGITSEPLPRTSWRFLGKVSRFCAGIGCRVHDFGGGWWIFRKRGPKSRLSGRDHATPSHGVISKIPRRMRLE
jgi:hypothetical protein